MSDDPLTLPDEHDAAQYLSPKWERREAELARKVRRQEQLRMKQMHGKIKNGGLVGGLVTAAMLAGETLSPGMLTALGISSPVAALITVAASVLGGYLKSTTTDDLPTDIKKLMAEVEAPTWDDIIDYVEADGRAISAEAIALLRDKLDDEELQKMIVARVNADADIPVVPETVEALGFNAAYDFAQGVTVPFLGKWAERVRKG